MIQAVADLFHKQGVHATSPDDVIEASNTGKSLFYHYFKNKEGLVHEVLQTHLDVMRRGTAPIKYELESWEDLDRWFMAHVELQKQCRMKRGCSFGTIGNELTENDELIRQDLSLIFEGVKNKLAAFFVREKAKGAISPSADEDALADFCVAIVQGAVLKGKIKRSSRLVENLVGEALSHVRRLAIAHPPDAAASPGPHVSLAQALKTGRAETGRLQFARSNEALHAQRALAEIQELKEARRAAASTGPIRFPCTKTFQLLIRNLRQSR
jgi:TetR/AcrR family transcriptional repressor of lmrAB and yxaGH operons